MGNFRDLTGQQFGRLTAIRLSHCDIRWHHLFWLCKCSCGGEQAIVASDLTSGKRISCGQCKRIKDITGQRFGNLLIIKAVYQDKKNAWHWLCKCDCGNEKIISGVNIRSGHTQSCGCYNRERTLETHITHGKTDSKIHYTYINMKQRCLNSNHPEYHNYGGRGITVCERWLGSEGFINFYRDMGDPPVKHELDRINNNGDYEPGNCRWATSSEQSRNTRMTIMLERNGENKSLSDWADIFNIRAKTLWSRLYVSKWDQERAFTEPVRNRRRKKLL
jgi:hypothetical protein